MIGATEFLIISEKTDAELVPIFIELYDNYDTKQWHQLTTSALTLFKDPRADPVKYRVFTEFLMPLKQFLNPLAYVSLGITASEVCESSQATLLFLQELLAKIDAKKNPEVYQFCELRIASIHVKLGELSQASKIIHASSKLVEDVEHQVIRATYYLVSCEYFKTKQDYTAYYRHALLYLACVPLESLTFEQKQAKAYDLAIAALLGDKVYNFGELILHPILSSLTEGDGQYKWLRDLVEVVNFGDISGFQKVRPAISRVPLLENSLPFLEQKICLMALLECVFKQPSSHRVLPFDLIARETKLQTGSKVEILVLKAFSLGLIEGMIDQVDKVVKITWLQPRVLNHDQVKHMRAQLSAWDQEVNSLVDWVSKEGQAVWA